MERDAQVFSRLAQASAEFWAHRSLEEIAQHQNARVVTDIGALAMPDWPRDETADEIIAYIKEQRQADRAVGTRL